MWARSWACSASPAPSACAESDASILCRRRMRRPVTTICLLLVCGCGFVYLAGCVAKGRPAYFPWRSQPRAATLLDRFKSAGEAVDDPSLGAIDSTWLARLRLLRCSPLPGAPDGVGNVSGNVGTADAELTRSLDGRIYRKFSSKNVSAASEARSLSPAARDELEAEIGVPFNDSERAFLLYDGHLRAHNKCQYALLRDPGPCGGAGDAHAATTTHVVVAVHSLPLSSARRSAVRRRLEPFRRQGYRTVFVVGRSPSRRGELQLSREAETFGDIIWADFEEDYYNLTIKTLIMLRWTERNCAAARHLVKMDDDVLLRVANLEAALAASGARAVIGSVSFNDPPYRDLGGKWYMPTYVYDRKVFPPFAHGPCYALTTDLLPELNRVAVGVSYVHLEDIFVAICAELLTGIRHVDIPRFISENCNDAEAIAIHGLTCLK